MQGEVKIKDKKIKQVSKLMSFKPDNWTTELFEEYLVLFPYTS